MTVAYKWRPIRDFETAPQTLTDGELESLQRIWVRQKKELIQTAVLDEFDRRLRREWAIETGIIENVYSIDRGVTKTLIEKGINAALIRHDATDRDPTLVARIIQDHYDTLETMLDFVKGQRQLSTGYVKELHAALLRNQETHRVVDQFGHAFEKQLEKGQYKTTPNSPTREDGSIHEYCPPEHVASEMDRLIELHATHETVAVPPEVEAAWLHHRFSQIHPFADGNGRVARAIASLVFIKANWFPLIIKREDWGRYIEALEKADAGDLRALVSLFVEAQRSALLQATEAAYAAKPIETADEAVTALRDVLQRKGRVSLPEWLRAKETAGRLVAVANQRLTNVAEQLTKEIASLATGFSFGVQAVGPRGADQIRAAAVGQAGQVPDFAEYDQSIMLHLNARRPDSLVLSFHGIGPRYRGIIGVVAYVFVQGAGPLPIEGGTFQINYEEGADKAQERFSGWLERVIVKGLEAWRQML